MMPGRHARKALAAFALAAAAGAVATDGVRQGPLETTLFLGGIGMIVGTGFGLRAAEEARKNRPPAPK